MACTTKDENRIGTPTPSPSPCEGEGNKGEFIRRLNYP